MAETRTTDTPLIIVEIVDASTGDTLAQTRWPAVPDVGERINIGTKAYTVNEREWGTTCRGDGTPIWHQQCVSLYLEPEPQARTLCDMCDVLVTDGHRDPVSGLPRCRNCIPY